MCFGVAVIDTALLPTLAYIVDSRHTSVYGSVYAIADISYCIAYAIGPLMAGYFESHIGFRGMNLAVGFLNILYAPALIYLKEIYNWGVNKNEQRGLLNWGGGFFQTSTVWQGPTENRDYPNPFLF